jgi:parallel beta-helix repeat protein
MSAAILVMVLMFLWLPFSVSAAPGQTFITIYIRPDGSIEPSSAPITTSDRHYYKLASDFMGSIVIERSGVVVDGGGHALVGRVRQGFANDMGLAVLASNVLVTGFRLYNFSLALIILNATSVEVSKCTVIGNWEGVKVVSSSNVLIRNNIMKGDVPPIYIVNSTYVEAKENVIEGGGAGIVVSKSSNAYIHENTISLARIGIIVERSDNVYVGGNRVAVPNDVGISVESSTMTIIFNNTLNGENEAGSRNINVRGSEKTVIHKNLLLNAPEAVVIDELSNHTTISYNYLASEDPFRVPTITLTGNSTSAIVYGNSGKMFVELHSSHEVAIENNTNAVIMGDTSTSLAICLNTHTSIELSDINNTYICGNLADIASPATANGIVVRGTGIAIHGNIVKNYEQGEGIEVSGNYIKIYENDVTNNSQGIVISGSNFDVYNNNVTHNNVGVLIAGPAGSGVVHDNFIAFNGGSHEPLCSGPGTGVCIYGSEPRNITFYHNSFINNALNNGKQVYITKEGYKWDNNYPSGGNYWSDYTGVDKKKGVNQDEPGSDGIGDTPYQVYIYPRELDRYPLVKRPSNPGKSPFNTIPLPSIVIEPPLARISTQTPTPTPTTTTKTTPITTPAPTAPPTKTTQSTSSTVSTTTTTPQRAFDVTMLVAGVMALIIVGAVVILLLKKRMS